MATACDSLSNGLDLTKPIAIFNRSDLNRPKVQEITNGLTEYEQIASYNWSGTPKQPIIIVPGAPKRLIEWRGGQLKRDEGDLLTDENHFMMPPYPMEPLFQAVKLCNKCVKFQGFDIVTDRSNLLKLFDILCFDKTRYFKPFRIDIQRIGNLVCLIRCEEADEIKPSDMHGKTYGKDFEACCAKPLNETLHGSYHQIVSYKLGMLKFIVRLEVDCADYTKNEESFVDLMSSLSLSNLEAEAERLPGSDLYFIQKGHYCKHHFVDLATRKYFDKFPLHRWPRMFLSGTETLIIGWQNFGKVEPNGWRDNRGNIVKQHGVEAFPIKEVLKHFGGFPTEGLHRFHNFLSELVDFSRQKAEEKIFSVYWNQDGEKIKIFENQFSDRCVVPDGLKRIISDN